MFKFKIDILLEFSDKNYSILVDIVENSSLVRLLINSEISLFIVPVIIDYWLYDIYHNQFLELKNLQQTMPIGQQSLFNSFSQSFILTVSLNAVENGTFVSNLIQFIDLILNSFST